VLLLVCPISASGAAADPAPATSPTLSASPDSSSDGVYQLRWETDARVVVIEEAPTARFERPTVLYRGRDRATVVTGRVDGVYHYRLRRAEDRAAGSDRGAARGEGRGDPRAVDAPVALAHTVVRVQHHPLSRALGFFAAGLFVFVATVWLVVRGPEEAEASPRTGEDSR